MSAAKFAFIESMTRRSKARRAFITAWARAPLKMGSVIPSSPFLAHKIAAQVDVHNPGWVVELGGGTGSVTHALLNAGVKPERFLVVERDRRLHNLLTRHFPGLHVVRGDAMHLRELLNNQRIHKLHAIVSCLPLLSMPPKVQKAIVEEMFAALPSGGVLVQFTYGPVSPISSRLLKRCHATGVRVGKVWLNFPPATVWRYEKG